VAQTIDDYFLIVGQLVPYKRFDLAIEVFNQLKYPLVVVGEGPEDSKLKKRAGENIRFVGRLSDAELHRSLSRCRALVFPGEEDFGMVVVEAHACGRPVIALGRGGALETVVPELNGLLFEEETEQSLVDAVQRFVSFESEFQPQRIKESAAPFDENRFRAEVISFISDKVEEHRHRFKIAPRRWTPASHDPESNLMLGSPLHKVQHMTGVDLLSRMVERPPPGTRSVKGGIGSIHDQFACIQDLVFSKTGIYHDTGIIQRAGVDLCQLSTSHIQGLCSSL
jgi:hypothetical protein